MTMPSADVHRNFLCKDHSMDSHGQSPTRQFTAAPPVSPECLFPKSDLYVQDGPPLTGGMGIVFKATARLLKRTVAIKRIRPEYAQDAALVSRFRKEAETMASFRHTNLVRIHALEEDSLGPYIVMEWINGQSLAALLEQKSRLSPSVAVPMICAIADALQVVHSASVIHRDIKPGNILLDLDNHPYVTDFGLVRTLNDRQSCDPETQHDAFIGSVDFMAPEQGIDPRKAVPQSDIWSLAATAFVVLTGHTVRVRTEQRIPPAIEEVLFKALGASPEDRYHSMSEFSAELMSAFQKSQRTLLTRRGVFAGITGGVLALASWQLTKDAPKSAPDPSTRPAEPALPLGGSTTFEAPQKKVPEEQQVIAELTNSLGMSFCHIPPGEFLMGSPPAEPGRRADEEAHRVVMSRGIHFGKHLVTQANWLEVTGSNPSSFLQDEPKKLLGLPVENISWHDALSFLNALNEKYRMPGYRYRLPTEAEWEYACRAGTTTAFSFGQSLNGTQANCDGTFPYGSDKPGISIARTSPVSKYPPNTFGLYDMHGNTWEWCSDWYEEHYYSDSPSESPGGPASGTKKVVRGGAWNSFAVACRSAARGSFAPDYHDASIGLRIVCEKLL